ncbi:MAG: hypothetical protein KBF58_11625 [Methyloversatilis sp.]|nr:hypothetical protein [Methyloversatilis sp.]MBP6195861.1 hypothetical protein [Methyloversatilis sp.]MBP9118715.1 hypothetical protein [Methyloversatilis sp.]
MTLAGSAAPFGFSAARGRLPGGRKHRISGGRVTGRRVAIRQPRRSGRIRNAPAAIRSGRKAAETCCRIHSPVGVLQAGIPSDDTFPFGERTHRIDDIRAVDDARVVQRVVHIARIHRAALKRFSRRMSGQQAEQGGKQRGVTARTE